MKRQYLAISFLIILFQISNAQVVTSDPVIPYDDQPVTIYFHAEQGNGGLANYTGDIYAHTGVLTNLSSGGSNWRYVIAGWNENIEKARLTRLEANLYSLEITPSVREFYGVPAEETITDMTFVFRAGDWSGEGKDVGNTDIFVPIYEPGLNLKIANPVVKNSIVDLDEELALSIYTTEADTLAYYINGSFVEGVGSVGEIETILPTDVKGDYKVVVWASNETAEIKDSISYYVKGDPEVVALPDGVEDGINYLSQSSVVLSFYAPGKESIFVIGDFSDWEVNGDYFMNITPDGERFWVQIDGLNPDEIYRFYYQVDHGDGTSNFTRFPDQHTELLVDPYWDDEISESTFPGITDLYSGLEEIQFSVINTDRTPYNWQVTDFTPPEKTDLVIYELLLRDFLEAHDWKTLKDTLDYLDNLGINAIELMPFNEFNANDSWGYNPIYFFAPDKYYGLPEDLKAFVDECHSRGIAVIQDIAFNHVEYWSTYNGLYQDSQGLPSEDNPWLNPDHDLAAPGYQTRHPYSVFLDFDHSKTKTQEMVDRVTKYWMEEYKIDGFRFDLTKGLTQKDTYLYWHYPEPGNENAYAVYDEGQAAAYNAERIGYLKRMADAMWSVNEDAFVILEHFCDNTEETELANYGMMIWGNHNHNYNEATMGYNESGKSNFDWISYKKRGWNDPHLIGYMESHDEERLMFKNLEYGKSSGDYSVKDLNTALKRIELAASFFFTIPGPKMLWQFGELGYDFSINKNGRTGRKPIRWDYYDDEHRKRLYQVYSALINLKTSESAFQTDDYSLSVYNAGKRVELNHTDMDVRVIGNFDVEALSVDPNFSKTGTWYEFFSGKSMEVSDVNAEISLQAGEYRLYTTKQLSKPDIVGIDDQNHGLKASAVLYPQPASDMLNISTSKDARMLTLYDLNGRMLKQESMNGIMNELQVSGFSNGVYFLQLEYEDGDTEYLKFIKQ